MSAREGQPRRLDGCAPALLAACLLAVTTVVRVPVELYASTSQDFSSGSRDVLLAIFGAGLALFLVLAAALALLGRRARRHAGAALVTVAVYAWVRSGFFPGPSVTLDGTPLRVDLSTGAAGLAVPVAVGALVAWLAKRQPRVATTFLSVILAGSAARSVGVAASAWSAVPPASDTAARSVLEWSRKGNVLVLILDSLQSDVFAEVLESDPRLRQQLDGFRYYRRASSSSPTTYLSLPTIHSGRVYEPGRSASEFFDVEIRERSVLNRLAAAGYRVSYATGVSACPKAVSQCLGTTELARSRARGAAEDAARLVDLGIYRIAPDGLRRTILERGRGPLGAIFDRRWLAGRGETGVAALERIASSSSATDSDRTAKMIHSMATHPPFDVRADCSVGEAAMNREAAVQQATCALRHVRGLLGRLQALGVYDVSSIVITADHGYAFESQAVTDSDDTRFRSRVGAFNPALLVKPAGARGPLTASDSDVALADLAPALCSDEACASAEGLARLDALGPGRSRTAFWYVWRHQYWGLRQIPGLTRYTILGDLLQADSWSREAAAYLPGTVIDFRRGRNSGPYREFGWKRPQTTHTSMADVRATVRLRPQVEPAREYELLLEAMLDSASAGPSRVQVEVNGVTIGEMADADRMGRFQEYRLAVPASVLAIGPETTIRFSTKEGPRGAAAAEEEPSMSLRTLELRRRP